MIQVKRLMGNPSSEATPGLSRCLQRAFDASQTCPWQSRLRSAPAGSFDRMYHQEQMMAHQQALNLHRTHAARGDSQVLRAMAARAVPVIQMHLNELQTHRMHMM